MRPHSAGALSGTLAAAVALGVGELLAGASTRVPSPLDAVGHAIIRGAPGGSSRTAVQLVGEADKPALIAGIALVWLAVGALIGIGAGRHPWVSRAAFAGGGALGALAAQGEPGAAVGAVGASTVLALGAGLLVLSAFSRVGAPDLIASPASEEQSGEFSAQRRRLLGLATGAAVVAAASGAIGRYAFDRMSAAAARASLALPRPSRPALPLPPGASLPIHGLTPLVTPNQAFYRIDTALALPDVDLGRWRLRVHGLVRRPFELSMGQLLDMPLVEEYVTIGCVSNEVGGSLVGNARWLGVPLAAILERAQPRPGATQVVGRSIDGFTTGFPTAVARDGRVALVAVGMNGDPLPLRHGFPARLVVAGVYGYVSATKWLVELELATLDAFDAYWVRRGWAKQAPIKTQSRIDVVRPSRERPEMLVIAGVAWAPTRGISQVEVQIDDGPWVEARLAAPLGDDTWRQWMVELRASAGRHRVRARATDGYGRTQEGAVHGPLPDGATGYHTVRLDIP